MSRSNNTEIKNPATKFFEWQGKGGFKYYDKEQEKNVEVPYPFRFIVLDQLTCIRGYSDADQSGFWSNEIRDVKKEILTVKTKNGVEFSGLYEQVKEKLGAKGADYCKSVYIGYYDENKNLLLGNIQLKGSAIGPWIDFCKANKVYEIGVQVKSSIEGKKGVTVYQIPVFEKLDITPESNQASIELDKELQDYFNAYFKLHGTEEVVETKVEEPLKGVPYSGPPADRVEQQTSAGINDLPF